MRYIDKYSVALKPKTSAPAIGDFTDKGVITDFEVARGAEEPEMNRWIINDRPHRRKDFKVYGLYFTEINPYGGFDDDIPDYARMDSFGLTREEMKNAFFSYKNIVPRSFRVLTQQNTKYKRMCEETQKGRDHVVRLGVEFIVVNIKGENDYVHIESYAQLVRLPQSVK
jgi:hypothetical protein